MDDMQRFKETYITLKLKISSQMAYRVYDEFEIYEELPDDSFIAETLYPRGIWLFYYVVSFGEHGEVLEPLDVRMEVRHKLKEKIVVGVSANDSFVLPHYHDQ